MSILILTLLDVILLTYWAFANPRAGVFLTAFSCFYLNAFASTTGFIRLPRHVTWLSDIALIALTTRVISTKLIGKRRVKRTCLDGLVALLVISGIIGSILNSSHPITAILGFRTYFKFILVFYLIVNLNLGERFLKWMFTFFLVTMAIQIPLSIAQALAIGGIGDTAGGTLFTYPLGVLSLCAISIILGITMYQGTRPHLIITAILLPFTWITAEVFGAFILLFPMILFMVLHHTGVKNKLKAVSVLLFCIPILLLGMRRSHAFSSRILNPAMIYRSQFGIGRDGDYNRFSGIIYSHRTIASSYMTTIFGVGPGNATPCFLRRYSGRFYTPLFSLYTQASRILAEFGYLGLALFLFLMLRIYRMNSSFFRNTNDRYWKALSSGFSGTLFVYTAALVYYPVLVEDQTAFFFWFFASAIYSVRLQTRDFRRGKARDTRRKVVLSLESSSGLKSLVSYSDG